MSRDPNADYFARKGATAQAESCFRQALNGSLKQSQSGSGLSEDFQAALGSYGTFLGKTGRSPSEVQAQLNEICREFGVSFDGSA